MPKISVIVPVYKVEKYIEECIESILAQTLSDIEIILVDDGSPDKSGIICDKYVEKDHRVKVFHKKNGGVSAARNYGMDHAQGEWLCFVDSDDTIEPTYLEDFGLSKSNVDMYMQGYKKVCNNKIIENKQFHDNTPRTFTDVLAFSELHAIINSPCFKLFKRSVVTDNNIRFDTNTTFGEDHLFSLQYVMHIHTADYSTAQGYIYRVSVGESLTRRNLPLDEVNYYTTTVRRYHDDILKYVESNLLENVFTWRYYDNIVRAIKTSLGNRYTNLDFSETIKLYRKQYKSYPLPKNYFKINTILFLRACFKLPIWLSYRILKLIKKR